ncbi:MAG: hypothetical protein M0Z53_06615 [Thermaerobacter sp.]|nr:hypothetical protein [Thermaerobacter sp.]
MAAVRRRRRRVRPRFFVFLGLLTVIILASVWAARPRTPRHLPVDTKPTSAKPTLGSKAAAEAGGTWTAAPFALPQPLKGLAAAFSGGTAYLAGGLNQTSSPAVYVLTGTGLRLLANLPAGVHDAGAAVLNGTLYVLGGGQAVPEAAAWQIALNPPGPVQSAPALFAPLSDATAISYGSAIYLVGGYEAGAPSNRVWQYRPGAGDTVFAVLPTGVRYAAVAAAGDTLYVAGGLAAGGPTRTASAINLRTGTVTRLPPLPYAVEHAEGLVMQGRFWVAGGSNVGGFTQRVNVYNPSTKTWQPGPPLPAAAGDGALVPFHSGALWIGGENGQHALSVIWRYTP